MSHSVLFSQFNKHKIKAFLLIRYKKFEQDIICLLLSEEINFLEFPPIASFSLRSRAHEIYSATGQQHLSL